MDESNRLFVGNLSWNTTEESLKTIFEENGRKVNKIFIATDRETQRPRGFGFVTMASISDAQAAIEALDGQMIDGRPVRVSVAQPRGDKSSGSPRPYQGQRGNGPSAPSFGSLDFSPPPMGFDSPGEGKGGGRRQGRKRGFKDKDD